MGALFKPPIGSRMKPQPYTNDFGTFQSNAFFGVEELPFLKNIYVMVQINPHLEPLPRFEEGFELCGTTKYKLCWTAHSRSKIETTGRERYNLSFPSGV